MSRMNRRGFTLVELLTTVAVIGLLASIALPRYQQIKKKATAAEVVSAMTTARGAAYNYSETAGSWPATSGLGSVPSGMDQYLPGGGTTIFHGSDHQLGWLAIPGGFGFKSTQILYAFMSDGVVCQSVYGMWGGARNADLLGFCSSGGGFVFLYVDR